RTAKWTTWRTIGSRGPFVLNERGNSVLKTMRLLILSTAAVLLASTTVQASTPASATLSKPNQTISWTGTFTASVLELRCDGPDLCDHLKLKINMGQGAKIHMRLP